MNNSNHASTTIEQLSNCRRINVYSDGTVESLERLRQFFGGVPPSPPHICANDVLLYFIHISDFVYIYLDELG